MTIELTVADTKSVNVIEAIYAKAPVSKAVARELTIKDRLDPLIVPFAAATAIPLVLIGYYFAIPSEEIMNAINIVTPMYFASSVFAVIYKLRKTA